MSLKDQTCWCSLAADTQRMYLDARLFRRNRRADLQHMRTERKLLARLKVVGIILHEGRSARDALAHLLHDVRQRGYLPVALAAVAVTLCHQVLRSNAGKLFHAPEILKGIGISAAAVLIQHFLNGDLLARLVADGFHIIGRELVILLIFLHQAVDFLLTYLIHHFNKIADCIGIHLPAELHLYFDLIAFGHRDLTHIIAKAHDLQLAAYGCAYCGTHPATDFFLYICIFPVSCNDLARQTHARCDEAVFAVAVRRLVQVHEIHVDAFVRNVAVELRCEVAVRLLEHRQSADPHLRRRKRVHPDDHARATAVGVCRPHYLRDFIRSLCYRLQYQRAGKPARPVHSLRHDLRVFLYLTERFFTV